VILDFLRVIQWQEALAPHPLQQVSASLVVSGRSTSVFARRHPAFQGGDFRASSCVRRMRGTC